MTNFLPTIVPIKDILLESEEQLIAIQHGFLVEEIHYASRYENGVYYLMVPEDVTLDIQNLERKGKEYISARDLIEKEKEIILESIGLSKEQFTILLS